MASPRYKSSISVKILAVFLVLIFFTQSMLPAYSYNTAYKRPHYTNLAPAPFDKRHTLEYKVAISLIMMIEHNHTIPIDMLTLAGVEAILNRNKKFLDENGVTFLPGDREIRIGLNKDTILRYVELGATLKDIPGSVVKSEEKTGSLIRQVLRMEMSPAPPMPEQLQLDFTQPPEINAPEEEKNVPVLPAVRAPPERPDNRARSVARERREIERLDGRILANTKSLLIMLEKRMYRSYRIKGSISGLRDNIAKYGYIRSRAFEWFSKDVSHILTRWRMGDGRKDTIRRRLAWIVEKITSRDELSKLIDEWPASKLAADRVRKGNPPAGSIAGVFEYLCSQNITTPEMSLSADNIAGGLDRGHGRSYETIKYDLRALYYHLGLLRKTDTQETGRDARYYVPESVKKKAGNIYPILERFVGKKLRPAKQYLMYAHKVIYNLMGIRDTSTDKLNPLKISKHTDYKGRFEVTRSDGGYKTKRFNIGTGYALSDVELASLADGREKCFEVNYHGNLIGVCDTSSGEFNPIKISRRTDDKGRFTVAILGYNTKLFNIGAGYASSDIELVPSADDWSKGFIVFYKYNPVAIYDAERDIFSLTFVVRRPDYKGRFILDGVRYNLGVNYAHGSSIKEIGIIPFYDFDWIGGFRVYHLDKEVASYDKRLNLMVGMTYAEKVSETPDISETKLAQTRVLLRMQLPNKATDQSEAARITEIMDFIIKHQEILGMKQGDVDDILNEISFNIIEHGNGGEITVAIESLASGKLWLKITAKDQGDGLTIPPDELVKASLALRKRFKDADTVNDIDVLVRGHGFSRIALDPDSVTIEYQGKRFVRFTNNVDAGAWFREENVAGATTKGTNFELKFDLGRDVASMWPETEKFDKIHDLFLTGTRSQIGDNAKILLSENLFTRDGDETELTQVRIALAPVLKSGYIAIMKPDDMRRAAMNRNVSKDKLAIVLTREEFGNKEIWSSSDKETSLKSSVLILDQGLTGNNYLYLEGVIGLARAVMANNKEAIRAYYELISGLAIDDEIMTLLDDAAQNNVSFAIKAILRFKLITRINPTDLNERRIRMENLLIAA